MATFIIRMTRHFFGRKRQITTITNSDGSPMEFASRKEARAWVVQVLRCEHQIPAEESKASTYRVYAQRV